jgi:hypothetical protein
VRDTVAGLWRKGLAEVAREHGARLAASNTETLKPKASAQRYFAFDDLCKRGKERFVQCCVSSLTDCLVEGDSAHGGCHRLSVGHVDADGQCHAPGCLDLVDDRFAGGFVEVEDRDGEAVVAQQIGDSCSDAARLR